MIMGKEKKKISNWGTSAYTRGMSHAANIYRVHGIATIRKLTKFKPINDYEEGKVDAAKKILLKARRK